jgi:hypothetical protein
MMIWLILLAVFTAILIALLMTPFYVKINTEEKIYSTGLAGFMKISVIPDEEEVIIIKIVIFFKRLTFYPFAAKDNAQKTDNLKTRKYLVSVLPRLKKMKFWTRVLRQFVQKSKIKELYLDIDTHDAEINGYLYPVFGLINYRSEFSLNVNFSGNFILIADVRNNLFNAVIVIVQNLFWRRLN